jgi:hypothetical protein
VRFALLPSLFLALSCGSESIDPQADTGAPAAGGASAVPPGGDAGNAGRGGSPEPPADPELLDTALGPAGSTAALTTLFEPARAVSATALAFDPLREGELWALEREFRVDSPCTAEVTTGCRALVGRVAFIPAATASDTPETTILTDGNAWHFMRRPTAIAFGDNGNFATCGEHRTGNYDDEPADYMGPTLWSSDPAIFGVEPEPGQNGTHLDMLHNTPFCMGIAHERDNVYWLFNGQLGALDRYDFNEPHVIGGEDHSDGELRRYIEGELLRTPEVPSHLAFDKRSGLLYVVDTGNKRLLRVDARTAVQSGEVTPLDPIPVHAQMSGATVEELVPPGTLEVPSGIALGEGFLFVTDNLTSKIYAFDLDGNLARSVDVEVPAGTLAGIAFGPDRRLYLGDLSNGSVYRLAPGD